MRLIFEGAMGTWLHEHFNEDSAELACRENPHAVEMTHRAYLAAGANALKTNSFGERACEIAQEAWTIANRASEGRASVFADIGPHACARELTEKFLALGAKHFLFETFPDASALELAAWVKARLPEAYIIVSFASSPTGVTRTGESARELLELADASPCVDAIGLNCVCGPHHMRKILGQMPEFSKPLCAMPNSGYPETIGGRTYFSSDPEYFAGQMVKVARYALHLGGCCGTGPEHIRAMVKALSEAEIAKPAREKGEEPARTVQNAFYDKLMRGELVTAVELDPPADARIDKLMRCAHAVCAAGADAITIADCPVARVRIDSSMIAARIRREVGIDTIAHMTCRDRNLNAARALLLGLETENVANVLAITGDPLPSDSPADLKGVFSYNSVTFAKYIRQFSPLRVYGALNLNAKNFEFELAKAKRKEQAGMEALFTQPILTKEAAENLARARSELSIRILGGIMPVVSHKNALFLHNEVPGMRLDADMIRCYEGLDREAAQELAIEISLDTMKNIRPYVDGYYLMTPFGRVGIIEKLIKSL